jgi:hypothetical protein
VVACTPRDGALATMVTTEDDVYWLEAGFQCHTHHLILQYVYGQVIWLDRTIDLSIDNASAKGLLCGERRSTKQQLVVCDESGHMKFPFCSQS